MTDKKISALTDLGGAPASTDVLPIVDSSANETKKVSVEDLFTNPDVTGTLTADGLTIEQSTTDALVNFKNTNSSTSTQTSSGLALYHNAGSGYAQIVSKEIDVSDNFADLQFYYAGGAGGAPKLGMQIASNGDVSLFEDTGITAKFYWDASVESLGLGTSSPSSQLHIYGSGSQALKITSSDSSGSNLVFTASGTAGDINMANGLPLTFKTAGTERMRIDSTGNVGIGNTTINTFYDTAVNVYGSGNSVIQFQSSNTGTASEDGFAVGVLNGAATDAYVWNRESSNLLFGTSGNERMRIDSSGNTFLQTGGAALQWLSGYQTITGDAASNDLTYRTYANHIWKTTTGASSTTDGSERMRIDSSGNVGIGTSSPAAKLEIGGAGEGIILASPDGTRYEITVANGGTLTVTAV